MREVQGFKCEFTGVVYEDRRRAALSEFRGMMKSIGGSLPAMGSVNSASIMEWLAGNIESEIYPSIPDKLRAALDYFDANLRKAG